MSEKLYKTTIEIWTDYDGSKVEIEHLSKEATGGYAICTRQDSVKIDLSKPENYDNLEDSVISFFCLEHPRSSRT